MTVDLPYMSAGDLSVEKAGDDLILDVGSERRRFRLTQQCGRRQLKKWVYENGLLEMTFE